jgi:hypothetical protein
LATLGDVMDFKPGDRVRIAEPWATTPDRPAGEVQRVIHAGHWVAVRFDGYADEWVGMARELEPE